METVFLILAAGTYFVFALFRLEFAVLCLSLFFPLYLLKGDIAGVPFTLTELLIYVTALAFILRWIKELAVPAGRWGSLFESIKEYISPRESFVHRYRYLLAGLAFFVGAALLTFFATEREIVLIDGQIFPGLRVAMGIFKGWIVSPILYLLLLLAASRSTRQALTVLDGYAVSAVALGLWGVYQVVTQTYVTPDARASGPFESANYLALYIAPATLYMLVRLREVLFRKGGLLKATPASLIFVGSLVLLSALVATKSYAALLAAVFAALFYFGMEYAGIRRNKKAKNLPWKFMIGGGAFVAVLIFVVFLTDPDKWQAMFQFAQRNSSSVRIEVYAISWGLLAKNWLLGIGMGQFPALYQVEAVNILGHVPYEWNMLHPHNLFLAMWLNLGLLGLMSFLYILALCLQKAWTHFRTFARQEITGLGKMTVLLFSLLLIVFIHGFFDTPFFKNDLSLLFWMVAGLLYAVRDDA